MNDQHSTVPVCIDDKDSRAQRILEIIDAIQAGLNSVDVHASADWKEFTKAFKTSLCKLGTERQFHVGASNVPSEDRNYGEWLYDVTWLDYDDKHLLNVPLVAEIEWGNWSAIRDDFEKLLLARADVRLMIFREQSDRNIKTIVDRMVDQILRFCCELVWGEDSWLIGALEWEDESERGWRLRWFTTTTVPSTLKGIEV